MELTLYAISVLQDASDEPFADANNMLGAPDGSFGSATGLSGSVINVNFGFDFSELPDTAVISNILAGMRARGSDTVEIYDIGLFSDDGPKRALAVPTPATLDASAANLVAATLPSGGFLEWTELTPSVLKNEVQYFQFSGEGTGTIDVDAVWITITFTAEGTEDAEQQQAAGACGVSCSCAVGRSRR